MSDTALLITLLLRGGQIALLLQIAWLLWRDYRHALAARLGLLLAIGTIAFVVNSTPPIAPMGLARLPITALDAGNSWIMFLFARALVDDDFRLRRWHALPWLLLAGIGAVNCAWLHPQHHPWVGKVAILQSTSTLLLALATTLTALRDWRGELVEPRRLVRVTLICGCGIYALSVPLRALAMGEDFATASRMHAFDGSLGITLFYCGFLLRRPQSDLLFPPANSHAVSDETPPPPATAETSTTEKPDYQPDPAQLTQLERLMNVERLYRHEDLSIATVAQHMQLPEYKLRQLINRGLGWRNFNAFVNSYRIADARQALGDAAQAEVPILTIAMDAGFQSLGPFNRAFKAETGLTPTAFRNQRLTVQAAGA